MRRDRIGQQWAEKRTFYRFFRIIQTWSALDWIWPHFCIISCPGIRKRVRLSGEMDWANTQKTLAQLLPSSCKILNLSHRKTSGTCQGLGHYISQWQIHNLLRQYGRGVVEEDLCQNSPPPTKKTLTKIKQLWVPCVQLKEQKMASRLLCVWNRTSTASKTKSSSMDFLPKKIGFRQTSKALQHHV